MALKIGLHGSAKGGGKLVIAAARWFWSGTWARGVDAQPGAAQAKFAASSRLPVPL